MRHGFRRLMSLIALVTGLPSATGAEPVVYRDRAAFELAARPDRVLTFDEYGTDPGGAFQIPLCPVTTFDDTTPCTAMFSGIEFVTTLGQSDQNPILIVDTLAMYGIQNALVNASIAQEPDQFYADFPGRPTVAFGFDVFAPAADVPLALALSYRNGTTVHYEYVGGPGPYVGTFWGIVLDRSDSPLARVSWMARRQGPPWYSTYNFWLDDLAITTVPEPSTAWLVGIGGLVLVARRRAPTRVTMNERAGAARDSTL